MERTDVIPNRRPVFLTILCIASFLGAAFSIIGSLLGFWVARRLSGLVGAAGTGPPAKALLVFGLFCTLAGVVGVVRMWKGRRSGFYIYSIATFAGAAVPILSRILMPALQAAGRTRVSVPLISALELESPVLEVLLTVVFIALYGMYVKAMGDVGARKAPVVFLVATVVLGALLLSAFALKDSGRITTTVRAPGIGDETLRIGYQARASDGQPLSLAGEFEVGDRSSGPGHLEFSSFEQKGDLYGDKSTGVTAEFWNLPSGRYVVYALYGKSYLTWNGAELSSGFSRVRTALELDLATSGTIQLEVNRGAGSYFMELTPVTQEGLIVDSHLLDRFFDEERLTLPLVKPGAYKIRLSEAQTGAAKGGSYHKAGERIGTWDVTVNSGATTRMQIPQATGASRDGR